MHELEILGSSKHKEGNSRIDLLKQMFNCLHEITDQLPVTLDSNGLRLRVTDSLHICMVELFISSDLFCNYRSDQPVTINIPLKSFNKILKNCSITGEDNYFKLTIEGDSPDRIGIVHGNESTSNNYELRLQSIVDSEDGNIEIDYTSNVTLSCEEFKTILKNCTIFSEQVTLSVCKDSLGVKQKADNVESVSQFKQNNESILIDCTEPVNVKIDKKYLEMLSKVVSSASKVEIALKNNDTPLQFLLNLKGLGVFKMYVAPQMVDDE